MEQNIPEEMKRIHVPTYEEILEKIRRRYIRRSSLSAKGLRGIIELERRRIEQTYNIIESKLGFLDKLPSPKTLHPFYQEIIRMASNDMYIKSIKNLRRAQRLIAEIHTRYQYRLLAAESPREAARLRREAIGRMLSVVKRRRRHLDILRKTVIALSRSPGISPGEPVIVVSGAPGAGKSTFVDKVSTASPEIAPYPFTTKTVILGHAIVGGSRVQIVDTPGILDRPLEEMNQVELRAVMALRTLADAVIFLIDPLDDAYYNVERQLRILRGILEKLVNTERVVAAVNKIDRAGGDRLREIAVLLEEMNIGAPFYISALKGQGVREVLEEAYRRAIRARSRGPGV